MKEILYIQAGSLSNYTGTHFWNTQEYYLSSDEQGNESHVNPEVSFCESIDKEGRSTLYPRALIFDGKSQFGTLSATTASQETGDIGSIGESTWTGSTTEHRQELVPKSTYHLLLEDGTTVPTTTQPLRNIRYWSDYSRVYFLPRSLQRLPEYTGNNIWDWQEKQQEFQRFNEEVELLDGALRLFVEDCDNMQGVQILNDTTTFGAFMGNFLASFRDEYSKLPSLTFPTLTIGFQHMDNDIEIERLLNEALYLRNLNELSSMNIPVEDPRLWPSSLLDGALGCFNKNVYHQSAVLSAHIETATIPFRLSNAHLQWDMASICGHLTSRNHTPFGELMGIFPVGPNFSPEAFVNFSSTKKSADVNTRIDVTRYFTAKQIEDYQQWSLKQNSLQLPYIKSIHTIPYPLPNSFPCVESQLAGPDKYSPTTISMCSSLSSSITTAQGFQRYAMFADKCIKRQPHVALSMGFSLDDIRELANDLWTICDNAGSNDIEV